MFRTVRWYSSFGTRLLGSYSQLKKAEKSLEEGKVEEAREIARINTEKFARISLETAGCNVTVTGLENIPEGPVLYVCNHQSNFDTAVVMAKLPKAKGFLVKKELEKAGFLSRWMKIMGCVFIDRSSAKKSIGSILEGIKTLKSGQSMVVFPEGTRSKSGEVGEFKAGSFKLATKSKVPIVPLTMSGTYKIMEANKNMIKPGNVTIYVHKPVYTDNLTKEDEATLPGKVKDIIVSKLEK